VFPFLIDCRGANAGAVYQVQLGEIDQAAAPVNAGSIQWEVFEDSTQQGMEQQIADWLAAVRAAVAAPYLVHQAQAGAGAGTRFLTIVGWIDFPPEPPGAFAARVAGMMRRRRAPEPEPEPEPIE